MSTPISERPIEERDDAMLKTVDHKERVGELMTACIANLMRRAVFHDHSKFTPDEWPTFAHATIRLKGLTYGSDEYKACLKDMGPAIKHHQTTNSHHPEAHADGIHSMTLLDVMEMLCDWKAATERHADGCLNKSFDINRDRFGISREQEMWMRNTAIEMGWLEATD